MAKILLAILAGVLPFLVLRAGAIAAGKLTGRARVNELLARADPADARPLNLRRGYDTGAVQRHWGALDPDALDRERRFLQLDLGLAVLFSAAFILSFAQVVAWTRPRLELVYFIVPAVALWLSDWTENLTLLGELGRYRAGGPSALRPERIRLASLATPVKILLFTGLQLVLLAVVAAMLLGLLGPWGGGPR